MTKEVGQHDQWQESNFNTRHKATWGLLNLVFKLKWSDLNLQKWSHRCNIMEWLHIFERFKSYIFA